jgi:formylglycine-generating enzyme required for sulfatase activity
MNNFSHCFKVLGLRQNVSLKQVRQAYWDLARVWHPDRFPDDSRLQKKATEKMQEINRAYQVLKDADIQYADPDPVPAIEVVLVMGGAFHMGDIFGDGDNNEKPVHSVIINNFYMGKYPITQGQWETVMGSNPSHVKKGDDYPVENISWYNVQEFIQKLNLKTGESYRLPTEAEWEYAARSGGKHERYAGTNNRLDDYGWCNYSISAGKTHPVGQKKPNSLNLYDMTGNVWEWCQDWYDENYYKSSPKDNPQGPSVGDQRILRGGCWFDRPRFVRTAFRLWSDPGFRSDFYGFRIALSKR